MKELITSLLAYEIYARIIAACVVWVKIGHSAFTFLNELVVNRKEKRAKIAAEKLVLANQTGTSIEITEYFQEPETETQIDTSAEALTDIAQKLLQQIDVESNPENEIVNKLEKRERESSIDDMEETESNTVIIITEITDNVEEGKTEDEKVETPSKPKESLTPLDVQHTNKSWNSE